MSNEKNPRKWTSWGYASTILIFIGGPLVSLLPESALGWIIYTGASIFGMIYTLKNRDKAIFAQFVYYTLWNVIAILTRML